MPSRNNYSERLDLTTSIEYEYGQGAVLFFIWIFKRYIFNVLKVSDDNNLIISIPFILVLISNGMWSKYFGYNNIFLQSKYHPFLKSQPYRMWKSQSQCKRASVWHSCLHLYLSRYFLQIKCVDWNPDWHMYNIVYQSMLHTRCNTLKIFKVEKSIFIVHHIYYGIYYDVNHWRWVVLDWS